MIRSSITVVLAVALLLGMFIFTGCGGGKKKDPGPTAIWSIRNSQGAFSGVTKARFGCGTVDSNGGNGMANYTVLDNDSSIASIRHSLPKSVPPAPGKQFNIYLPVAWRDSDGDKWPDSGETQYMWRDSTYIYSLVYGTGEYAYPGWSKWRMWYSGGVAYKRWMYNIQDEISGTIYTGFYSTRSTGRFDDAPDRTVTLEDIINATEIPPSVPTEK